MKEYNETCRLYACVIHRRHVALYGCAVCNASVVRTFRMSFSVLTPVDLTLATAAVSSATS